MANRYFSVGEVEGGYIVNTSPDSRDFGAEERRRVATTLTAVGKMLREHFADAEPEEKPIG